jgi:hypothetical protein
VGLVHLLKAGKEVSQLQGHDQYVDGCIWGVFVTREHVRHNKSGIAHRGRTGINH